MAVRTTMLSLINFVRAKIGDPDNGSPVFATQDIQDALDAARFDITTPEVLIPVYSYSGQTIVWLDHYSQYGFWEDSPTLLDFGLQPLTATLSELLREPDVQGKGAHWKFATTQLAVRAMGHSFDVWQVAANLLEQMIMLQAPTNIDINLQGANIKLSQITQFRLQMVASYRAKQRIGFVPAVRDDVLSQREWERQKQVGIVASGIPFLTGQ